MLRSVRKSQIGLTNGSERRKIYRVQKRALRTRSLPLKPTRVWNKESHSGESDVVRVTEKLRPLPYAVPVGKDVARPKLMTRVEARNPYQTGQTLHSQSRQLKRIPGGIVTRLAEDDAEIDALERKLGLKGKKGLPKVFKDDGLDELLEGLDEDDDGMPTYKSRRTDGAQLIAQKRAAANKHHGEMTDVGSSSEDNDISSKMSVWGDRHTQEQAQGSKRLEDNVDAFDSGVNSGESGSGFDSKFASSSLSQPQKPTRENPYIAPTSEGGLTTARYMPPSLRKGISSDAEAHVQLRRQTQGLLNRLTESNLISILSDVEKLYRENPRQHVTSILVDLLLISVCQPANLPDTLIILPAGFIAAIYKIIGTDFGTQVIQKVVELFGEHHAVAKTAEKSRPGAATSDSSKELSNLISLLANLYNFQVVGSNLLFDYIRIFLSTLSELTAELLLRIIRTSGPQLRQDGPSSLKDISNMLRPAIAKVGEHNISVRMKFMIETINDLRNNRMRNGAAASAVTSEHTIRMKRILGSLNRRSVKASEPLRIGLKDILQSDKDGKWWLVGASWMAKSVIANDYSANIEIKSKVASRHSSNDTDNRSSGLDQLAREQRMNTDIRRAIFVTIMSGVDYQDAYVRLMKLKLKKSQELEIPKVLIHCSSAERQYNPYYTLIARNLCGDRKLKMAFQFSFWDLFRRLEQIDDGKDVVEGEDEHAVDPRQLVNLARMFGSLIVEGSLGLKVLKHINLSYLQPKTKMFVEVLFITIFLQLARKSEDGKDERAIINIVSQIKDTPCLVRDLQCFLKTVVAKTDIAGGKTDTAKVKWSCRVAEQAFKRLLAQDSCGE